MRLGFVVALLVAACGGGSKQPAPIVAAPATSCTQAADHLKSLFPDPTADKASKLHDALETRCTADHWAIDTRDCIVSTATLDDPKHCKDKLTAEQRTAFEADVEAIDHPPAPPAPTGDFSQWPPACRDYLNAMRAMIACDKLPPESRDSLQQGLDAMTQNIDMSSLPPDAMKAMEDGCRQGADAIKTSAAGAGC